MYEVYDQWPKIARDAFESDLTEFELDDIDHIVFVGMGGSGSIGDLFSAILSKTDIHVSVVKGYLLPKTVDSKTLVVVISISGNTVETLTVLESASKINCNVIAFSSGGKIESFCNQSNIQFRRIPAIHSPRASYPAYVYSILRVLISILPITKSEIIKSINELEKVSLLVGSHNLDKSNPSLQLANWISGIPLLYFPAGLQAAAIRFKNSLQENTKIHVIIEDVIEACHNGIVSWETTSNVQPILIQGKDDNTKTKERWKILKEYFDNNNIDYLALNSIEGNILSKLVCLVYVMDFASIYNAIKIGIDPSPVTSIDFIKEHL